MPELLCQMLEIKIKCLRWVDKAKMRVRQERCTGAKLKSHSLSLLCKNSLLPRPHPEPGSTHPRMHIVHKARRLPRGFVLQEGPGNTSFPTVIRNALRGATPSLKHSVVTPLHARKNGRTDHPRAELINIHDEFRWWIPKIQRPVDST